MNVQQEYQRLRALFQDGTDEKLMAAVDGALMEAARIRVQLNELNQLAAKSGLVKYDVNNPSRQKVQPVARTITQVRASYINYIAKIAKLLGGNVDEEDDDFDDYE